MAALVKMPHDDPAWIVMHTVRPQRVRSIDAARGVAILLMVLDHSLVLWMTAEAPGYGWALIVRLTLTRASMPLFMLCTGILLRHRGVSWVRVQRVAVVAAVVNVALIAWPMGIFPPEILAVWCLVMCVSPAIRRWPILLGCVGVLQLTVWPIGWHGYEPGMLVVFVSLGFAAGPSCLDWADRLPAWVSAIGRRPLTFYVAHMAALTAVGVVVL